MQSTLLTIAAWGGTVIPLAFLARYTMHTRWWHTPAGQTIAALDACIVITFGLSLIVKYAWNGFPLGVESWIDTIVLLCISPIVLYRLVMLEIGQRQRRSIPHRASEPNQS